MEGARQSPRPRQPRRRDQVAARERRGGEDDDRGRRRRGLIRRRHDARRAPSPPAGEASALDAGAEDLAGRRHSGSNLGGRLQSAARCRRAAEARCSGEAQSASPLPGTPCGKGQGCLARRGSDGRRAVARPARRADSGAGARTCAAGRDARAGSPTDARGAAARTSRTRGTRRRQAEAEGLSRAGPDPGTDAGAGYDADLPGELQGQVQGQAEGRTGAGPAQRRPASGHARFRPDGDADARCAADLEPGRLAAERRRRRAAR